METVQTGGRGANPEDRELAAKSAVLATLEGQLADRELDLATRQAVLATFVAGYSATRPLAMPGSHAL